MINQFLATLDNNPEAPAGFLWPTFTARTIAGDEAGVRAALIGTGLSREEHFLRCLQLVSLVMESPLADHIAARDPRITYSRKAVQDRLALAGIVVQYTGSNSEPSSLNLVVTEDTPDSEEWTVEVTSVTEATITDSLGNSVDRTFSMSGGISTLIGLPLDRGSIRLYGEAPQVGDTWTVSYRRSGVAWVEKALARLDSVPVSTVLTPELKTWYDKTPLALDRLAAVVVGLADR